MSPAMKEMDDLMTRHQLLHVHNTCFRWTFGNVRCHVDGNGNIKPLKNKSIGRIDPPVAAIISIAVWMIMRTKHTYDTRHLRGLGLMTNGERRERREARRERPQICWGCIWRTCCSWLEAAVLRPPRRWLPAVLLPWPQRARA